MNKIPSIKVGQVWKTVGGETVLIVGRTLSNHMPFKTVLYENNRLRISFWVSSTGDPGVGDGNRLKVLIDDGTGALASSLIAAVALDTELTDRLRLNGYGFYEETIC